jgi:hypothetical protein
MLRNGSEKKVAAATNTRNNRTVERVVFYAVRVVPRENRRLVLPRMCRFPKTIQGEGGLMSGVAPSAPAMATTQKQNVALMRNNVLRNAPFL